MPDLGEKFLKQKTLAGHFARGDLASGVFYFDTVYGRPQPDSIRYL